MSLVIGLLGAAPAVGPAARLLVWFPDSEPTQLGVIRRALGNTPGVELLHPALLTERFPPSRQAQERAGLDAGLEELLAQAERAFTQTRFSAAAQLLGELEPRAQEAPSAKIRAVLLRACLLRGRIALAERRSEEVARAFGEAAALAPEAMLDAVEYPPSALRAFEDARRRLAALPKRKVAVQSAPPGAEVAINGELRGRTPLELEVSSGHCQLVISLPGHRSASRDCRQQGSLEVRLEPATAEERGDHLRERLAQDLRWFSDPQVLEALSSAVGSRWVLALERVRGEELEAHLYWAVGHILRPLTPPRAGTAQLEQLFGRALEEMRLAEGLSVSVRDGGPGKLSVGALAGDPSAVSSAALHVRVAGPKGYQRFEMSELTAGRFELQLADQLAKDEFEYFIDALAPTGELHSRYGSSERPVRFRRLDLVPGPATVATFPSWYNRWYVWAGLGVATAGITAAYLATRPPEVVLVFGAPK